MLEFLIERGRIKVVELPQARFNPVPGLIEALGDKDPRLRQRAAEELAKSGPYAQEAMPALKKAMQDEDRGVREAVANTLKNIENQAVARAAVH
jgi:HEAT repeat protein